MKYNISVSERRSKKRYHLNQGAYVAFNPYYTQIGPIINICHSGLACHYFIESDQNIMDETDSFISIKNNLFLVENIPINTISNYEIDCENSNYLKMMYCGVKFKQLTFEQFRQLDDFIIYNSTDETSDRRSNYIRRSKFNSKKTHLEVFDYSNNYKFIDRRENQDRRKHFKNFF